MSAKTKLALASLLALCGSSLSAQNLAIEHDPIGCVRASKFPRFFARFNPTEAVSRARLHFRPDGWPHWYSVPMSVEHHSYAGTLPKPEGSLRRFSYYISVTDRSFGEARTQEYAADVVSGVAACEGKKVMAASLERARQVLVNPPEGIAGAPKVPAGFSSDGVVAGAPSPSATASNPAPASPASPTTPAAPATTGATTTAGAAAAGGASGASGASAGASAAAQGGGLGTKGLLIIGGVAAAGGGVALAVSSGGGSDKPAAVNCASLAPSLTTLTVSVAQPTGTPQFSWNPVCPVASLLVEQTSDGTDVWSTAGNLLPPVTYGGPALSSGQGYRVILFNANDDPLGTQTFTH